MEEPQYHLQAVVRAGEAMEDFNGPLDVILLLLKKNKIEIQDIRIADILDQYLAWLDRMKQMDLEITSSFLIMASWLVYIKSRMLLSVEDQAEAQSDMDLLIQSLQARRRQEACEQIRGAAQQLEAGEDRGLALFTKGPEPKRTDAPYRYRHTGEDLQRAWAAITERREKRQPPSAAAFDGIVGAEPFPVAASSRRILQILMHGSVTGMERLFQGNESRSELVATFLAVLELSRLKSIYLGTDADGGTTVTWLKMPEASTGEENAGGTD